jgi:hypothetical protein
MAKKNEINLKKARQRRAKGKAPAVARKPKPRLPGMEDLSIPAIDQAAETYCSIRNERMSLTEQEAEAAAALLAQMHEHNQREYRYDGKIVFIAGSEKVRVRKSKEESAEEVNLE